MQSDPAVVEPPGPQTIPYRPFRMSDAMILIAAMAVALVWDRGRIVDPTRWISSLASGPPGLLEHLAIIAVNVFEFLPPLLIVGSATVLGLRLRSPRPPLRQLARQPGMIACAVATLFMVPATLAILSSHYLVVGSLHAAWRRTGVDLQPENLRGPATMIGAVVAVSWVVLMRKQRWLPEPSWIDRLGRLLGVGWMLMIFGGMILPLIAIARML